MVEIVVLERGGSLSAQILGGKGRPPPTIIRIRKLESLGYRMVKKLPKIAVRGLSHIIVPIVPQAPFLERS